MNIQELLFLADDYRQLAVIRKGSVSVGCSLWTAHNNYFGGANIELAVGAARVHAEEVAIIKMLMFNGSTRAMHLAIVSEKTSFTPCGKCLDWIVQFGTPDCLVTYACCDNLSIYITYTIKQLMPHYPS